MTTTRLMLDPIRSGDRRALIAALVGFLCAAAHRYQGQPPELATRWIGAALLFEFAIPCAIAWLALGAGPRNLGITFGDWRYGLPIFLAAAALTTPLMWLAARDSRIRAHYPQVHTNRFWLWAVFMLIDYFALEFLWRGYFQIGLGTRLGALNALMIQVGAACLAHWNKPEAETLVSVLSGTFFGLLSWRTRSMIWPMLIHAWIGIVLEYFCSAAS
jgi:hypothetical protein